MKRISVFFAIILSMFIFAGCMGGTAVVGNPDLSINMTPRQISIIENANTADIVELVAPAVVGISSITGNYESVGSGVAIANGGYILTNHHVVSGAKKITVYFANKTSTTAELIWEDSSVDLAVIKSFVNMPYLKTFASNNIRSGEDILAVGTPLTLQFKHTVTKGIVSALDRTVEIVNNDGTYSYLQNLIQHDASINPGNSGGPLINMNGEVVGINTLKVSEAEGIGFAIPIEVAEVVVGKIAEKGTYVTPYLGVYGFDAIIAQFYERTLEDEGVYLLNVDSAGPAGKAGLKINDVITKIGNKEIKTMLDLRTAIYDYEVGDKVTFTYRRNNITNTAVITLVKR